MYTIITVKAAVEQLDKPGRYFQALCTESGVVREQNGTLVALVAASVTRSLRVSLKLHSTGVWTVN